MALSEALPLSDLVLDDIVGFLELDHIGGVHLIV